MPDKLEEVVDGLLVLEPRTQFDPAIIGVVERFNDRFVLYSKRKVIDSLIGDDELAPPGEEDTRESDAMEHYEFNIRGAWVGESTPGFLDDIDGLPDELMQPVGPGLVHPSIEVSSGPAIVDEWPFTANPEWDR